MVYADSPMRKQVAWHKLHRSDIEQRYRDPLEELSAELLSKHGLNSRTVLNDPATVNASHVNLNTFASDLNEIIIKASDALPQKVYKKYLKPYWSQNLTQLTDNQKTVWRDWVNAGRPRSPDNDIYLKYKDAKRVFRSEKRRAVYEYDKANMTEIFGQTERYQTGRYGKC